MSSIHNLDDYDDAISQEGLSYDHDAQLQQAHDLLVSMAQDGDEEDAAIRAWAKGGYNLERGLRALRLHRSARARRKQPPAMSVEDLTNAIGLSNVHPQSCTPKDLCPDLTPRQERIWLLKAAGYSHEEIGDAENCTASTVSYQLDRVQEKLRKIRLEES